MGYLTYWSLMRQPFKTDDDSHFFAGVSQREAIAGVSYLLPNDLDAAFLVAATGCGMSHLFRNIAGMKGFGDFAAEVICTDGDQPQIEAVQSVLVDALGFPNRFGDLAGNITRAIDASESQGLRTVWLIDRCGRAAATIARQLVGQHASFSVVIGTQPESFDQRVVDFGRVGMRIDLDPLSLEETFQYVQHCLRHAGGRSTLFGDATTVRLFELTGGVLADLAQLAESSLQLSARYELGEITPGLVEAALEQTTRMAA